MSESPTSPVSFLAFIYSLMGNAAVHFGDMADPATGTTRPTNLEAAQQVIDLLSMLEQKTRGNLTDDERRLLEGALHELRMKYVEASKKGPSRIVTP